MKTRIGVVMGRLAGATALVEPPSFLSARDGTGRRPSIEFVGGRVAAVDAGRRSFTLESPGRRLEIAVSEAQWETVVGVLGKEIDAHVWTGFTSGGDLVDPVALSIEETKPSRLFTEDFDTSWGKFSDDATPEMWEYFRGLRDGDWGDDAGAI